MTEKKTFTTHDIAKMLDVYPTTVANWIDSRKLKAYVTPGGHRRVSRENLIDFLDQHNMPLSSILSSRKKMILVVDDDESIVNTIVRAIRMNKPEYDIITADDGFKAGHAFSENHPDLVILDIMLPGLDGFNVCKMIRKKSKAVKILIVTAYPSDDNIEKLANEGADGFIAKPFKIKSLIENIEKLINN